MNEEYTDEVELLEEIHHDPAMYFEGDALVLEHGAVLPSECCVKCGRPSKLTIRKKLRNPFNPLTWFGKRTAMDVGLCHKHHESRLIAVSLTWSFFGIGVAVLVASVLNSQWIALVAGVLFALVSGVFRASYPCRLESLDEESDIMVISGVGPGCRKVLEKAGAVAVSE